VTCLRTALRRLHRTASAPERLPRPSSPDVLKNPRQRRGIGGGQVPRESERKRVGSSRRCSFLRTYSTELTDPHRLIARRPRNSGSQYRI
jgi:hypothetical protein